MRVCTQRLFFEEVEPDKWVHNAVSLQMLAPPVQALISHWFAFPLCYRQMNLADGSHSCDDGLRIAGSFGSFLRNRKYQESDQPGDSAFKEAFNSEHLVPFALLLQSPNQVQLIKLSLTTFTPMTQPGANGSPSAWQEAKWSKHLPKISTPSTHFPRDQRS